jgi:hypothetical protein
MLGVADHAGVIVPKRREALRAFVEQLLRALALVVAD